MRKFNLIQDIHWDDDMVLRGYLNSSPEPQPGKDTSFLKARLQMMKVRMHELQAQSIATGLPGVENEFENVCLKRKILCWHTFPILDLPTEILSEIFSYVVYSTPSAREVNWERFRLTWTCKRFREVAINHQTMWSTAWFLDDFPWTRSLTFVERSGTSPIDVRLNDKIFLQHIEGLIPPGQPIRAITVKEMRYLLKRLLPKIAQLRTVVVMLQNPKVMDLFLEQFSSAGYPMVLERFDCQLLRRRSPSSSARTTTVLDKFLPPPKLRWLTLAGVGIDFNRQPAFPLKVLHFRRIPSNMWPTSEHFIRMLTPSSSTLVRFMIDDVAVQRNHDAPTIPSPVILWRLLELNIFKIAHGYAAWTLQHIRAPNLTCLTLIMPPGEVDFLSLVDATTGLFPELELLSYWVEGIAETPYTSAKLVRWLRSFPRLRILKVACHPKSFSPLYGPLAVPGVYMTQEEHNEIESKQAKGEEINFPIVCPALDIVHIECYEFANILEFVAARKKLGVEIRKLYFVWRGHPLTPEIAQKSQATIASYVKTFYFVHGGMPMPAIPEEQALRQ